MILKIKQREHPFVQVDKKIANAKNLSFKAKGLMTYLLGLPDNWEVYLTEIVKHSPDGIYAVRSAINELIEAGYITKTTGRRPNGKFYTEWLVQETPCRVSRSGEAASSNIDRGRPLGADAEEKNSCSIPPSADEVDVRAAAESKMSHLIAQPGNGFGNSLQAQLKRELNALNYEDMATTIRHHSQDYEMYLLIMDVIPSLRVSEENKKWLKMNAGSGLELGRLEQQKNEQI